MAKELKIVGKRHPKIDGGERVSGKAEYASDVYLPGMLYGKTLRSPHPHAKIVSIDTEKAKALPGVKAIITAKDIADFPWYQAPGRGHHDMPLLVDTARFVGDDIAVVAAVDEDVAQEALALIKVEYQTLPFVLDPEEALKPAAPKIYPKGNLFGEKPVTLVRGNVEKGFQEADLVYEGRYTTPMLQHVTAEPRVCVARWNRGRLTVWDSLAYTFGPQASLAHIFKIPMSKVRVICEFMGGGFGDKNGTERYHVLASILSMKTGQPVRIEFDREESFLATTHRYPMVCYLKYGAKKDGTLTAIEAKVIADMGAYRHLAGAMGIMETMKGVYRCPNLKAEGYDVYTNKPEGGFMRCVGHPQGQVAQEIHMDIMAEKLGMDPVAFRLKNHARLEDGDQDTKTPFSSNGMEECIRKGAEAFGWTQKWQKPGGLSGPHKERPGDGHSCLPPRGHGSPLRGDGENQFRRDGERVHWGRRYRREPEIHDGHDRGRRAWHPPGEHIGDIGRYRHDTGFRIDGRKQADHRFWNRSQARRRRCQKTAFRDRGQGIEHGGRKPGSTKR
jgi:CO/xanthine dehydrogenase Mo-binding subunit